MQREYQGIYRVVNQLNASTPTGAFGSASSIPTLFHRLRERGRKALYLLEPAPQAVQLQANEQWSVVNPFSTRITVNNGTLWATQEGDARDYLLQKGEELVLPANRRIVVSALHQSATLRVRTN